MITIHDSHVKVYQRYQAFLASLHGAHVRRWFRFMMATLWRQPPRFIDSITITRGAGRVEYPS